MSELVDVGAGIFDISNNYQIQRSAQPKKTGDALFILTSVRDRVPHCNGPSCPARGRVVPPQAHACLAEV